MRALEAARKLDLNVAINLIVDPAWDTGQFELVRQFAESVPEIVHLSVMTPCPGTEIWHSGAAPHHARLPTVRHPARGAAHHAAPEGVLLRAGQDPGGDQPQAPGVAGLAQAAGIAGRLLGRGQTDFLRMLWQFSRVYNGTRQYADHQRPVRYELPAPGRSRPGPPGRSDLDIHARPAQPAAAGHDVTADEQAGPRV
ncbi:MAG: hypothetical protein ACRDNF_11100 [Streptosporangiaceae bacterium]